MSDGLKRHGSLYLIDPSKLAQFYDFMPAENQKPIAEGIGLEGYVVTITDDAEPPGWSSAIEYLLKSPDDKLLSQRAGALIFIKYKGSGFIISFGMGFHKLKMNWYVLNFGKRIAMNSIPYNQLSGMKLEQVLATWHQSSEKSPTPTAARRFGMESDRDLVHGIEGVPIAKYVALFGPKIMGNDSLHFNIDFHNIKNILENAIERFNSTDYKNIWPELNYISNVSTSSEIEKLDKKLDDFLKVDKNLQSVLLVCPILKKEDLPTPASYWIGRQPIAKKGSTAPTSNYLQIADWKRILDKKGVPASVETAKSVAVHIYDTDGKEIHTTWVYSCICFETQIDDTTYFLSGGAWYGASTKFIEEIENQLLKIKRGKPGSLMAWNGTDIEAEYNKKCVGANGVVLFDVKLIMFGGKQSKFEFCDLFDPKTNTLYFVKKISGSSNFSHLAEQIRRTVELVFSADDAFRAELIKKIEDIYPKMDKSWISPKPKNSSLPLSIVSMGKDFNDFPFFAKSSLVKLYKELERSGFEVEFLNV